MAAQLTLPEEFALLSLAENGKTIDYGQAKDGCALAELGELALRGKLLIPLHNLKVFGFLTMYGQSLTKAELVDAAPVGLDWADELLAELGHAGVEKTLSKWLSRRRDAFLWHRGALVARGLVRHVPDRRRPRRERYYPDPTMRNRLINEVRLATGEGRRLDAHRLFLSDMVIRSGLYSDLRVPLNGDPRILQIPQHITSRRARDRAYWIETLESVPEPLRATSQVLAQLVPRRLRD
jgi:hypothetical protein